MDSAQEKINLDSAQEKINLKSAQTGSPCVLQCRLEGLICVSCKRSLDEIARWRKMSDEERAQILKTLPHRPVY